MGSTELDHAGEHAFSRKDSLKMYYFILSHGWVMPEIMRVFDENN